MPTASQTGSKYDNTLDIREWTVLKMFNVNTVQLSNSDTIDQPVLFDCHDTW